MRLSTLNGTRYLAKKRAIAIALLVLTILAVLVVWSQFSVAHPSTPSGTQCASSSEAELYTIDESTLSNLVKRTDVEFLCSSGESPPYYAVVPTANTQQAVGLVYLTTDVAPDWTYGYTSRIAVLVFVNQTGTIESLKVWHSIESWNYLITEEWMSRFIDRSVYEPLEVGQDLQGITSATITSKAIASGVREAGRQVVDDYEAVESEKLDPFEQLLASAMAMIQQDDLLEATGAIALFGAALVAYTRDDEWLRYAVLVASLMFIGIYMSRMVSIVDLTGLMWATLPPFFSNLYWYALYGSMLVTSLIWGRVYCGYLCPFGAFTQIINKLSPIKRRIPFEIHTKLAYVKYLVLAAVAVGVLLEQSWITGVEPFQTFFLLRGDWWMWAILIGAVVLSVPFTRFYCDYICPAGAVMSLIGKARVKEIKRWPECERCKICQQTCPQGAIIGPRILVRECMNCRDCEKNYLDSKICPHYIVERLNAQR